MRRSVGDLATAQGNLPEAQRLFGEVYRIKEFASSRNGGAPGVEP